MLRRTSVRKIAYCKPNASNWAAVGTSDAYQTQTSMLKANATTALANANAMSRMPQLRLVQTMMLWSILSVTILGRYGDIQSVLNITAATATKTTEDLIITKCGSLVTIVEMPATTTSTTLRYCSGPTGCFFNLM